MSDTAADRPAETMRDIRDRVLLATLPQVPFEGWTPKAMRLGAADAGFDQTMAERAFPGGTADMVDHFSDYADRRLIEDLAGLDLEGMRIPDRIRLAIQLRLEAWAGHREAALRAMTFLTLPQNGPLAVRSLWRTVDTIWRAIGDTSADFSWYTKRASLGAIFSATLLVWLEDRSEDRQETWGFLDRRLADMGRIAKARKTFSPRIPDLTAGLRTPFDFLRPQMKARRRFGVHAR